MMTLSLRNFLLGLGYTVVSGAGAYTQQSLAGGEHLPAWLVFLAPLIVMALKDVTPLFESWIEKQGVVVQPASPAAVTGSLPTITVTPPAAEVTSVQAQTTPTPEVK